MKVAKVIGIVDGTPVKVSGHNIKLKNLDFARMSSKLEESSFKVYNDLNDFKDNILQSKNIWAIYRFKPNIYQKYERERYRYEDIVCGFLEYYDREVRNGMTDHAIYFHWGSWGTNTEDCVVIFIDKPPLRTPLYEAAYEEGTIEIDPPLGQVSDPPKPPPPPPPPPY
jgi:hypothetical protein